jgi:hypothetical protein
MLSRRLTQVPVCLFSFLLFAGMAFANSGSFTINLSSTPTPLNCSATDRYVSSFKVTAAGGSQKAYIGLSDLNTVTLHHVAKIIFPNTVADANGNPQYTQSESYTASTSSDAIDLCSVYVAAEGTYGAVTVNFVDRSSSYAATPDEHLVLSAAGPVNGSCDAGGQCQNQPEMIGANGSGSYSRIEFWVVPGDGEKVQIGFQQGGTDYQRELFPNMGDTTQAGAHSEGFSFDDAQFVNGLSVEDLLVYPEQGGSVLFSGWTQYNGDQFQFSNATTFQTISKSMMIPTSPGPIPVIPPDTLTYANSPTLDPASGTTNGVTRFSVSMVPGSCGKVNIFYDETYLRTLVANCMGGWSDTFLYEGAAIDVTKFKLQANDYQAPVLVSATAGPPNPTAQLKVAVLSWPAAHQLIPIPHGTVSSLFASNASSGLGKVYIGTCDMNTATGFHVAAILFPIMYYYEKEEQFSVADPRQLDSIDSSTLCVTGDMDRESVSVWAASTGNQTSYFNGNWGNASMVLTAYGTTASVNGSLATPLAADSTPITVFRSQAIPGQYGTTVYGTGSMAAIQQPDPSQTGYYKTLLTNQGDHSTSDAHSETFRLSCTGLDATNCLDLGQIYFWQQYGGQALISAWTIMQ